MVIKVLLTVLNNTYYEEIENKINNYLLYLH